MTQGWLFKKSGGGEKQSWSPLRGKLTGSRSNWKRRWFRLEGPLLTYYEREPKTQQAREKDALYKGDLRQAQVALSLATWIDSTLLLPYMDI